MIKKEDFTKPRVVQRYSQYTQNNDIQDFTDHVAEEPQSSQDTNLPTSNVESPKGIFQKIKEKLLSLFGKNKTA